MNCLGTCCGFF